MTEYPTHKLSLADPEPKHAIHWQDIQRQRAFTLYENPTMKTNYDNLS